VFAHVPKTGGNYVRRFVDRHFEVVWTSGLGDQPQYHVAYDSLPPEYSHLPAVSFVRNPWDYYVSQWAWLVEHGRDSRAAQAARRSFDDFLQLNMARDWGGYARVFADITRGTEVRRYERLSEELLSFFHEHDVPTTPELERDLLTSPRVNVSEHGTYQKYYGDESRALVADACRDIIETYGYTFD